MRKIALETQYDTQVQAYAKGITDYNKESRELFFTLMPDLREKTVLDLACGDGTDARTYALLGAHVTGVDASKEMVHTARQLAPAVTFVEGKMEAVPLSEQFDVITCKYALQTSRDIKVVYEEMDRLLKPGGTLLLLVTHPLRQFLEKKGKTIDYFAKEIVRSHIFEGKIELHEPSHTFNEYLSPYFLTTFDLQYYFEREEFPGAERIDGHNYPCYCIIKAIKRGEKQ